jgi:plastocyanin
MHPMYGVHQGCLSARVVATIALTVILVAGCGPDGADVPVATEASISTAMSVGTDVAGPPDTSVADETGKAVVEVIMLDNVFVEPAIRIDVGSTVVWRNEGRARHTIEASGDWGSLSGLRTVALEPGAEHSITFDQAGTFDYFCNLHGTRDRGMTGVVVVGDGRATPSTSSATEATRPETTSSPAMIRVPSDVGTIQEAVDRAGPGTLILIAPGVYHEAVVVTRDDIVIRGEDRNEVVLDGNDELDNGIEVLDADGVAIENLTVRRYTTNGLFWTGVEGYRASYVTAANNRYYGIYAFDSQHGRFEQSYASGSADSGFYVGQCKPCDATVTDVVSELNSFGFSGANTTGVVIENSTWRRNRAGIVIGSLDNELLAPQQQDEVRNNVVQDNGDPLATRMANGDLDVVFGIGIAVIGGLDNVVRANNVIGNSRIGIAVAPNPAIQTNFWPAERNQILDNIATGNGDSDLAIAAVPDVGGNCFAGNTFSTSAPSSIEQVAPCAGPATADPTIGAPELAEYLDTSNNPPGVDYQQQPLPGPQPNMPDAFDAPAQPATHR